MDGRITGIEAERMVGNVQSLMGCNRILADLTANGAAPESVIAKRTGMRFATVRRYCDAMLAVGWVRINE